MEKSDSENVLGQSQQALRHQVVRSLLKEIIQGVLPAGTRLVTSKLSFRFGVSATPIREALVELQQSGGVELLHHRGAVVKPFGRKEVRDFYDVRKLLECEAVRLACPHVDNALLSKLKGDLERLVERCGEDDGKWISNVFGIDQRIHQMTIDHCATSDSSPRSNALRSSARRSATSWNTIVRSTKLACSP